MVRIDRKQKILLSAAALLLVAAVLLPVLALTRCGKRGDGTGDTTTTGTSGTLGEPPAAVVADDPDPRADFAAMEAPPASGYPECPGSIGLSITGGPGRPAGTGAETRAVPQAASPAAPFAQRIAPPTAALLLPGITIKPSIHFPIPTPTPTPPPSTAVSVTAPTAGSVWRPGESCPVTWTVNSGRDVTVDLLLSTDGGATWAAVAEGLPNTSPYAVTLPDRTSDACVFRVDAWVGTVLLGYNVSPVFTIAAPLSPTPSPTPSPEPTPALSPSPEPTPPVPSFIPMRDAFVSSEGDPVRWVRLDTTEIDGEEPARLLWQVSAIPFACREGTDVRTTAGLLASGELDAGIREFAVDFGALDAAATGTAAPEGNHGAAFTPVAGWALPSMAQRALYVRVVALDASGLPIGRPGSGIPVLYGHGSLDLEISGSLPLPDLEHPVVQCKTTSGTDPGSYRDLAEDPLVVLAGTPQWGFCLAEVPRDSVEIDLQFSTTPFETADENDYRNPAGLVWRSDAKGLVYTPVTRYYTIPFDQFAPAKPDLGENTVRYYVRAVCYLPTDNPSVTYPAVSLTGTVFWTGDPMFAIAQEIDKTVTLPTEEVEVESYVPSTDFLRYEPVQWEDPRCEEMYEVTRPLTASDICFSLKNEKTGDVLLPWPLHKQFYPSTTPEQYQALIDKMLPVGAWFHLTIVYSDWDEFCNEFWGLLTEIYNSIREAYNGIQASAAGFIADRFAFLGEDVQGMIRYAVERLIDSGLAMVGLPPELPNFEGLVEEGMDYCLEVALAEAAKTLGVPVDQVPESVRDEISAELTRQVTGLESMNRSNPLDVDFLKPATAAMYRPAYVDVRVFNKHDRMSAPGTLTVSFVPVQHPGYNFFEVKPQTIPALAPYDSVYIRVFLKERVEYPYTDFKIVYDEFYFGEHEECRLTVRAQYDVPDIEAAADAQGAAGPNPMFDDVYVWDLDPVFTETAVSYPCDPVYDIHN
ncbi:MAG: hypothetical protein KBA30_10855 [Clostridia bacterium]|nr:hypothetical protein [Clostridia bacterium]